MIIKLVMIHVNIFFFLSLLLRMLLVNVEMKVDRWWSKEENSERLRRSSSVYLKTLVWLFIKLDSPLEYTFLLFTRFRFHVHVVWNTQYWRINLMSQGNTKVLKCGDIIWSLWIQNFILFKLLCFKLILASSVSIYMIQVDLTRSVSVITQFTSDIVCLVLGVHDLKTCRSLVGKTFLLIYLTSLMCFSRCKTSHLNMDCYSKKERLLKHKS